MKKKDKTKLARDYSATRYIIELLEAIAEKIGVTVE